MKRFLVMISLATAAWSGVGLGAHTALAATLCVGSGPGCYATVQSALNAAQNGDVIHIGPGMFAGSITITKSVTLSGAGSAATIIQGGSHVLTIGSYLAPSGTEPTVSIANVTITSGDATTSPFCSTWVDTCGPGYPGATALGGGILIPPAVSGGTGATVSIANSIITGNRATPVTTVPSVAATCPGGPCPFALGVGGGIDSWGALTLSDTTVGSNQAGEGVSAGGVGAGIADEGGNRLTLAHCVVTANSASVAPPNAREAAGGGIFVGNGGTLAIADSVISNNVANVATTLPDPAPGTAIGQANSGGVAGPASGSVTIDNTQITGNTVRANDPNGGPVVYDSGLYDGGAPLILRNSQISNNHVSALVVSTADGGQDGSALEFDGPATISNTRITGNTVSVTASTFAGAIGTISAFDTSAQPTVISNSLINGNSMSASSPSGTATVQGGGIVNDGLLQLNNDQIIGNTGVAAAPSGFAEGGGIANGPFLFPATIQLSLENTLVIHNTLSASEGLAVQGGGLFTPGYPVTLRQSVIAGNVPDQCSGC